MPWNDERRAVLYFVAEMKTSDGGMAVMFMTADIDEAFEYANQLLNDDLEQNQAESKYAFHFDAVSITEKRGGMVLRRWQFDCMGGTQWVSQPTGDIYSHQSKTVEERKVDLIVAAEAIMNQAVEVAS